MNREGVKSWLDKHKIDNYTINEDLSVDVNGDVSLFSYGLFAIPVKFGTVSGYFHCSKNKFTTLEGCPTKVGGNFYCHDNWLTSLDGGPVEIGGDFHCDNNRLVSLVGGPEMVGGDFSCHDNKMTTLEGCPIIDVSNIFLFKNNSLKEDELFLYDCNYEQIRLYYNGKRLNEKLLDGISEEVVVGIKKCKI